jgi:hypothetical protein
MMKWLTFDVITLAQFHIDKNTYILPAVSLLHLYIPLRSDKSP